MISARRLWGLVVLLLAISSAALAVASSGGAVLLSEAYDVDYALITPNEQYILFSGNTVGEGDRTVYRHDLMTSNNVRIASPSFVGELFYVTPDSQYLFFGYPSNSSSPKIYRVPVSGGPPTLFANAAEVIPLLSGIKFTTDSQVAVYRSGGGATQTLLSQPVAGGAEVDLTTGSPEGSLFSFIISPGGDYVAYRVEISPNLAALMVVPTAGGTAVMVNPPNTNLNSDDYAFAENENAIVFRAFNSDGSTPTLYRADLDGSNRTMLNAAGLVGEFVLSPDEQYALFTYRPNNVATASLERVTLNNGALTTLIAADGANYFDLVVSPVDNRVIYQRFSGGNRTTTSLVYAPVGTPVSLAPNNGPFPYVQISEDGEYVVYLENTEGPLYSVPADGATPPQLLSPPGDIDQWYIAPSQSQVYFTVEEGAVENLYTVPIEGGSLTPLYQRTDTTGRILTRGAFSDDRLLFIDFDPAVGVEDSLYLVQGLVPPATPTPTASPTATASATPPVGATATPTGTPPATQALYLPLIQKQAE